MVESTEINPGIANGKVDNDEQDKADRDGSVTETSVAGTISNDEAKPVRDHLDVETSSNAEALASNLDGDLRTEKYAAIPVGIPSNSSRDTEVVNGDPPLDSNQNVTSEDGGSFRSSELSASQTVDEEAPTKTDSQSKDVDLVTEHGIQVKQHEERKTVTSAAEVQEQLDEVNYVKSGNFFVLFWSMIFQ